MEVDDLFQIGENIIYPMYGPGIIQAVERKEFLGETQQYYVITMLMSKTQIMIPADKILTSKIRRVTDITELKSILDVFQQKASHPILPWKQRYKINTDKIKTGKMKECAEVVRDLMQIKEEKALNTSEKAMLAHAHKFLISELGLIEGITENQRNVFS